MATATVAHRAATHRRLDARVSDPAFQAFALLRVGFTVAPILFGLDKFLNWLVDWEHYLAPQVNDLIPGNAHQAMLAVGVIEIVAGLVVAVRPRFGGYLVAAWLTAIALNLIALHHFDIAVRDLVMATGALTLARLTELRATVSHTTTPLLHPTPAT